LDILDRDCEGDVNKAKMILKRLRKRLTPEIIKNIYGLGYRFNTTSCKNSSKHSH
jgi:DNA-binding response OmpR family regulator